MDYLRKAVVEATITEYLTGSGQYRDIMFNWDRHYMWGDWKKPSAYVRLNVLAFCRKNQHGTRIIEQLPKRLNAKTLNTNYGRTVEIHLNSHHISLLFTDDPNQRS